jgi:predicted nucleic acid-binding protein
MKVFDASSIFTAVREKKTDILKNSFSVVLARYEIGNVLWKETSIRKLYTAEEGKTLINFFDRVFSEMKLIHPELEDVYTTALRLQLSFYDASYVHAALKLKLPLVTEDKKIKEKAHHLLLIQSFADVLST